MTEGAVAVYVALATALAVWATIAIYLGRVGARLRTLQRDLERLRPPDPPTAPPTHRADAAMEPSERSREQQREPQRLQSFGVFSKLGSRLRGNDTVVRLGNPMNSCIHDHQARALRDPLHVIAWMLVLECGCGAAEWLLNTPEDWRYA